jgi:hypothetical protein
MVRKISQKAVLGLDRKIAVIALEILNLDTFKLTLEVTPIQKQS